MKATCCDKISRKGRACSKCPLLKGLGKKARKKLTRKA